MTGVCLGHILYFTGKKLLFDNSISVAKESQIGFWLGSAAFFSGFAWQPLINVFQVRQQLH
jgi:hypothetical protein